MTPTRMTAAQFRKWLKQMNYSHSMAGRELGVARQSIIKWTRVGTPRVVRLACKYLELR